MSPLGYALLGSVYLGSLSPFLEEERCEIGTRTPEEEVLVTLSDERCLEDEDPYPLPAHFLSGSSHTLSFIEYTHHFIFGLEDGSLWEVLPLHAEKLKDWQIGHTLVIAPNYSWFGSGNYAVTNEEENVTVLADLIAGPFAFGSSSHWVAWIDMHRGHITLEDGSSWCINPSDYVLFADWQMNDHIILGRHYVFPYDHVLINVPMNSHLRAMRY